MTKYRFFYGQGESESAAVQKALTQCGDVMLDFPSLVVELVEMVPNASGFDAHLRVMAISDDIEVKKFKSYQDPSVALEVKPNDDLGRREGVEHEAGLQETRKVLTMASFDLAVKDGAIPDIPTQDLDQFKGLGMSVEEVRNHLSNKQALLQLQLRIDTN